MMGGFMPPMGSSFGQGTNEYLEIAKAWASVSVAFAIMQVGGNILRWDTFLILLLISSVTAGLGIVVHELAHRVVARHYGSQAHFVASPPAWLLVPIAVAFLGLFVAAPGAVWCPGPLSQRQHGIIALAGPVSNLLLALIFYGIGQFTMALMSISPWLLVAAEVGFFINAWLGLFNMIPLDPIDGAKVLRWDRMVFGVTIVIAALMVFAM